MFRKTTIFSLAVFCFAFASCNKFEGSQTVPAYIHIDQISVDPATDYSVYGAPTHKITEAWVYVDDQIIGCYELPATFPVLKNGPHKVAVYGGIKADGRTGAYSTYPFYKPTVYQSLNLVEDSIINLNPVVNYYSHDEGTTVAWLEDFENANSLVAEPGSDTSIIRISGNEAWNSPVCSVASFFSGKVELPPDSMDFTVSTATEFDFYKNMNGVYCMLEMDYCCNDTFFVGVKYFKDFHLTTWPLIKVTPTDKEHDKPQRWNKIYINIGPTMNNNYTADYFKVYFTSDLTTSVDTLYGHYYHPINERRYYYFDNLKLLYRKL